MFFSHRSPCALPFQVQRFFTNKCLNRFAQSIEKNRKVNTCESNGKPRFGPLAKTKWRSILEREEKSHLSGSKLNDR